MRAKIDKLIFTFIVI